MVADYFTVNKPVTKYGSERNQALRAKRSKPVAKAKGYEQDSTTRDQDSFGPRNPDGSMHQIPGNKSKRSRPA